MYYRSDDWYIIWLKMMIERQRCLVNLESEWGTWITSHRNQKTQDWDMILRNNWKIHKDILPYTKDGPNLYKIILVMIKICILKTNDKKSFRICFIRYDGQQRTYLVCFMRFDGCQRNVFYIFTNYYVRLSSPIKE